MSTIVSILVLTPSFVNANQKDNAYSSTQDFETNIGIWCQSGGCFDGAYTLADMGMFYNASFGTGNFNSMEMYTPEGMSWGNGSSYYASQVEELALASQKYGGNIKMMFAVSMDYNYNGTVSNGCNPNVFIYNSTDYCNPEYTQLRNFLLQDAKYPSVYAFGVNWERAQFGCDYSFSACGWLHGESVFGNSYVNQSINFFVNMVSHWGKQVVFPSGSEHLGTTINPGPGKNWNALCGANSVNNYPNPDLDVGTFGAGYWYAGCHGSKAIYGTSSQFIFVGIADGMFQSYNQPAQYYESQISDGIKYPNVPEGSAVIVYNGTSGSPCIWTAYQNTLNIGQSDSGCAPSGQWNGNTISWWFQQQNLVYTTNGAASRQFMMMGMDSINVWNRTGQTLIYPNVFSANPYKYWNSLNFECNVKAAEASVAFSTPSNVTVSYNLPCSGIILPTTSTTTPATSTAASSTWVSSSESSQVTKSSTTPPVTSTSDSTSVHATHSSIPYYVLALAFLVATATVYLTFAYSKRKRSASDDPPKPNK